MNPSRTKAAPRPSAASAIETPAKPSTLNPQPSTILLAVTGMSPAVLTETVWALARQKPPVVPDRVVVVTTIEGKATAEKELFTAREEFGGHGVWDALRSTLAAKGLEVRQRLRYEARVFQIWNEQAGRNQDLNDLRTRAENDAAADFLLEQVRSLVEIPGASVVASIAGGRKTMGALLYGCMTLLGRETDRLTHVLVNAPFDTALSPGFYYPEQMPRVLRTRDGKTVKAASARIDLAEVPFVPLRNLFERDLVRKPATFTGLVQRCRQQVQEYIRRDVRLQMTWSHRQAAVNGTVLKLSPLQCLLLLFLAHNAATAKPALEKYTSAILPLQEFAKALRQQCHPENGNDWRDEAQVPKDFDDQGLRKVLDELKSKLRKAGPEAAALIPLLPEKGRFSLDLPPTAITLKD